METRRRSTQRASQKSGLAPQEYRTAARFLRRRLSSQRYELLRSGIDSDPSMKTQKSICISLKSTSIVLEISTVLNSNLNT